MPLGTGDFESVSYSDAPHSLRAPRVPQFNGHPPPPSGYGNYPAHDSGAPASPNSLSPVAMVTASNAAATGPQRAQVQETFVIRSRPTFRAGMTILLAGAILGGSIGITMRARQNAADAAFAEQVAANPTSTPSLLADDPGGPSTLPQGSPGLPPQALANSGTQPGATVVIPPSAAVSVGKDKDTKDKDTRRAAHGFAKWSAGHATTSSPAKASAAAAPVNKKESKDKDDGWTVASAGNGASNDSPKEAKEPKETKVEKSEPKEAKVEKSEPKEAKVEKSTKKGGAAGGSKTPDDVTSVLKAAMGATENTL